MSNVTSGDLSRYEVFLSETARLQLKRLPADLQERIKVALAELNDSTESTLWDHDSANIIKLQTSTFCRGLHHGQYDPYRPRSKADIKKIKGPKRDYYRLRIGNFRAMYVVEGNNVKVAKILALSTAYNWID